MIKEVFSNIQTTMDQGGYQIDKTKLRRKYEAKKAIYPERDDFRRLD